jgi:hypothetical protein
LELCWENVARACPKTNLQIMEFGSLHQQFEIKIRKGKKKPLEFPTIPGENDQMAQMRKEMYFLEVDRLDNIVAGIMEKNNEECVDMVLDFLKWDDHELIPVAVVQGGHSGSDRAPFYTQLEHSIKNSLCILDSSVDSIKECLKRINEEFVGKDPLFCDFDIQKLVHWYTSTNQQNRLVIVVPDFEGFDADALQKLILICFSQRDQVPISFVFGVATNMNTLHQNLSKSAFACLNSKLFTLVNSRQCLCQIITEYFLNSDGIKLGYGPYRALMDRFLDRDLSILSFVRGIKYALMCHFFGNPLSLLLHPDAQSIKLEDEHIMHARILPSFIEHIESLHSKSKRILKKSRRSDGEEIEAKRDIEEIHSLLADPLDLEQFMKAQVSKLKEYNKRFSIALKLLHQMNSLYKSNEVKKSIFYLYEVALCEDIMENENVKVLMALFTYSLTNKGN